MNGSENNLCPYDLSGFNNATFRQYMQQYEQDDSSLSNQASTNETI